MRAPLLSIDPVAKSNTKSYSLDLPAATISRPSVCAQRDQADQQRGLVAVDRRHHLAAGLGLAGEFGADHAVDLLGGQCHVPAGLDREARMAGAGFGVAGGLDQQVERQAGEDGDVAGGDVLAAVPGGGGFGGVVHTATWSARDAD